MRNVAIAGFKGNGVKSAAKDKFDEAYYQRYYFDKKTSVVDPDHVNRLGAFVCSYLQYLRVPVRRVLDVGCGIGLWRDVVKRHYPHAQYQGVEYSEYLCGRFGWERGSVVDYRATAPYDLVICQGVLPYLSATDLKLALANLGRLSQGALYVEAVTREDWEQDTVDETLTDPSLLKHAAAVYRRGLNEAFTELGGGVWLSHDAQVPLFALEHVDGR
jgi:predicted TPR repeat methyltransferase